MEETEFKFEPFYILLLIALDAGLVYLNFRPLQSGQNINFDTVAVWGSMAFLLGLAVAPMAFKMLTGVPAIELTSDALVDNIWGITIDWSNIQSLRLEGSQKPFIAIDLKDTNAFYANINNPLKRLFLKFTFLISPGNASIYLAFVAGDNDSIVAVAKVYLSRFYGEIE